jgi:hypothetical protein
MPRVPFESELPGPDRRKTFMPFKIYRCRSRNVSANRIDVGARREKAMQA